MRQSVTTTTTTTTTATATAARATNIRNAERVGAKISADETALKSALIGRVVAALPRRREQRVARRRGRRVHAHGIASRAALQRRRRRLLDARLLDKTRWRQPRRIGRDDVVVVIVVVAAMVVLVVVIVVVGGVVVDVVVVVVVFVIVVIVVVVITIGVAGGGSIDTAHDAVAQLAERALARSRGGAAIGAQPGEGNAADADVVGRARPWTVAGVDVVAPVVRIAARRAPETVRLPVAALVERQDIQAHCACLSPFIFRLP